MSDLTTTFTNIANAIRSKTGSSDTMTPSEMPDEIAGIETPMDSINITQNGTYEPSEGRGYNQVIVEVPEPTLITKSITANGTYSASADNADGYSSVTVAVDGFKKKSIANTPTDIASFNDGTANPMPSLEISIEPQQDLHGYDYPWVGGAGKNLLNIPDSAPQTTNGVTWRFENGLLYINGTCTSGFSPFSTSAIYPSNMYTFSAQILGGTLSEVNNSFNGYNSNNERKWLVVFGITGISDSTTQTDDIKLITVNINTGANFNNAIIGFQVERGSSMTAWQPYSNICPISGHTEANVTVADDLTTPTETHTLSIPFHDDNDNPITVYGGTLNVTSGELRVDRAIALIANCFVAQGSTTQSEKYRFGINLPGIKRATSDTVLGNLLCSSYPNATALETYRNSLGASVSHNNDVVYIYDPEYATATVDEFKNAKGDVQLVYELATPQTYQLTPTQVSTLLGQNNIFTDCGQILQGEYFVTL